MSILALAWSSIVTLSLLSGDLLYIVLTYNSLNARGKPCRPYFGTASIPSGSEGEALGMGLSFLLDGLELERGQHLL